MVVKVMFSLEPRPATTVMMATEMPAAIRPYSMAVAPLSSLANFASSVMFTSPVATSELRQLLLPHEDCNLAMTRYYPVSTFAKIVGTYVEAGMRGRLEIR